MLQDALILPPKDDRIDPISQTRILQIINNHWRNLFSGCAKLDSIHPISKGKNGKI